MSMSKSRDREIRLFGKTITSLLAVSHHDPSSLSSVHAVSDQSKEASSSSSYSPVTGPNTVLANSHEQDNSRFKSPCILSHLNERPRVASEKVITSPRSSKINGDQQSEITSTSEDKPTTLEKPDKILPCPRCESANTKFCYYNNYNVSQPRYFCRNCQRYWTAGGSMRNVPVGSGRRKNKGWASSNHYLQVTYNNNSRTILSFGSSESSATETGKNQHGVTRITAQENKTQQGFLPSQVMSPNKSSPWPYQWSPTGRNASFYPVPFYWGCTVPIWPTSETSPCLGKRSRDQTEVEPKDTTTTTKNVVWPKLPTKPEKKTEGGFSLFDGFETKSSNRSSLVPETSINLQANHAALSRSMNFRENMQQ